MCARTIPVVRVLLVLVLLSVASVVWGASYQLRADVGLGFGDGSDVRLPIGFRYDLSTLRGEIVSVTVPFSGDIHLDDPEGSLLMEVRTGDGMLLGEDGFHPPEVDPPVNTRLWVLPRSVGQVTPDTPNAPHQGYERQGRWHPNLDGWAWGSRGTYRMIDLDVEAVEAAREAVGEIEVWFHKAGGSGLWDDWSFSWPLLVETNAPPGDFNNDGLVEQGDLDMVLGFWGGMPYYTSDSRSFWVTDYPGELGVSYYSGDSEFVDQTQLDQVLSAWGDGVADPPAVPEPSTWALMTAACVPLGLSLRRSWSLRRRAISYSSVS